eukprot:scaffold501835_cov16-Prasinocladus_malaysianus.AAC.1
MSEIGYHLHYLYYDPRAGPIRPTKGSDRRIKRWTKDSINVIRHGLLVCFCPRTKGSFFDRGRQLGKGPEVVSSAPNGLLITRCLCVASPPVCEDLGM